MLYARAFRQASRWSPSRALPWGVHVARSRFSSSPTDTSPTLVTDADVDKARAYCLSQVGAGDHDAHLVRHFLPRGVRDAYLAVRTLNLELARLPETVSNATLGHMRMQFWQEALDKTFDGRPPREPVSLLLYAALAALAARSASSSAATSSLASLKFWLQRLVRTRQQHMDNRPFASLAALEAYAESTYATLMYVTLAVLPLRSMHVDHLASHIGKACGIAAVLRSIPVLSAPPPPSAASSPGSRSNPVLLLPLDVMADVGLREEDVFRQGPQAPGLQEAVFRVATRANDHLITAREMLRSLRAGAGPGHDFEHEGETGHVYGGPGAGGGDSDPHLALQRGFSVLLEAVPAQDYLARLEAADFDAFHVKSSWKLPWLLYRAQKKQQI